jgi:hypothetical protein
MATIRIHASGACVCEAGVLSVRAQQAAFRPSAHGRSNGEN